MWIVHSWRVDLHLSVRAFVAVARLRSFSAAAIDEGTSQPVISRRVAGLESVSAGRLLDRTSRQVRLTPLGMAVLGPAQQFLEAESAFLDAVRAHHAGAVRLVVPRHLDPIGWAGAVLYTRAHGQEIEISEAPPSERADQLSAGMVDAALLLGEGRQPSWTVPLGIGSAAEDDGALRLLRPTRAGRGHHVDLVVTEEDGGAARLELLRRAVARLGFGAGQVRPATNIVSALANVSAGDARLVCSQHQATLWGLRWRPAPELDADRRYHLKLRSTATAQPLRDVLGPAVDKVLGMGPTS
jgi:DNA-binding transcriptional LysR family regulator